MRAGLSNTIDMNARRRKCMSQDIINQLRLWITEQGLDAFMVTQPQNRSYLSGWLNDDVEGAGLLLVGQQQQVLLTNTLYREVAENEAKGWQVIVPTSREYAPAIVTLAQEQCWKQFGIEAMALTYGAYEKFRNAGAVFFTLKPFESSIYDMLRQVKLPHVLDMLRRVLTI